MIVIEERLSALFEQLPSFQVTTNPVFEGFKPVYKWGNEHHLIKQLKLFDAENKSIYPLIYQTSKGSKQNSQMGQSTADLRLILATRNTEVDLLNEQRWALSYKNILYPLVNYIEQAFNKSGIIIWDGNYTLQEFPNYGDGMQNETTDIWDALSFECSITLKSSCVKQIKFFN